MLRFSNRLQSALGCFAWLTCLVLLGALSLADINAAPPSNDQCFSSEIIPGAGPFPYLTSVSDVKDATTAGDPPVPERINTNQTRSIWYAFTPSVTAVYTLSTCQDAPTDTTLVDDFMMIYTSAGGCSGPFTQLPDSATTHGFADDSCGPGTRQAAITTVLEAGVTYYIVVWQFDGSTPAPGNTWVQMRVSKVQPPVNNTCDNATELFLNTPLSGAGATSVGAQNTYQISNNVFTGMGQIPSTAAGPEVVYTFTAPETASYNFTVRNFSAGSNLVIYVASACPGAGTPPLLVTNVLGASHRNNFSSSEQIYNLPLTSGQQVYVFVDENVMTLGSRFTIEVNKCNPEIEPNNSPDTANALTCPMTGSISNILGVFDVDYFALGAWPAGSRVFAMVDASAGKQQDFDLRITTTNISLQFDNDSNDILFGDKAPNIAGTPLPEGPTFVRVNFAGGGSYEPYTVYAVVQPPMASATVETEPNNTFAQASTSPINYFAGSLSGPAPSTDVDVFVVNASEGDLIFASLDGDPLRNLTPIDAQLELLDSQGNVLVGIDNLIPHALSSVTPATTLSSTTPYSPSQALVYRVTSEGAYYVRVSSSPNASATTSAGDYLLSISKNCFAGDRNSSLPPIIQTVTTAPITENQTANLSVSFSDVDRSETHTVVIDWGDGQVETSVILAAVLTNYSATHVYLDNPNDQSGNYHAIVTVLDQYQTSVSTNISIKVLNAPPTTPDLSLSAAVINEGGSVTLSGSFTDPGTLDTHNVSVSWGDGSSTFNTNLAVGQFAFSATHRYLNNKAGGFTITTTVQDKDGGSVVVSTNLTVNNVAPTLSNVSITSPIIVGSTATLNGNISDVGTQDTFTLTVNWGDGTANTVANYPAGTTSFNLTHLYSSAGTNRAVSLTLSDSDNGTTTAGTTITVQQPAKPRFQSIAQLANGHMRVLLQGATPNVTYSIQTSATLLQNSWSPLATAPADASGNIIYEDPTTPLQPKRMYRAVWP